jgi:hypothetical protein
MSIRDYLSSQFGNDEQEAVGIGGFITAARVSERVNRSASVPTTFLEDGSHINDHIIRNPLTLSIEGNVSDSFFMPSPVIAALQAAQAQSGSISQYAPARTQAQLSKVSGLATDFISAVDKVDNFLSSSNRVAAYLGFQEKESNIEDFIDTMESLQEGQQLISIDMPFRTYDQMYITSLEITRTNQTNSLDFTMELQQFRFADTIFVEISAAPAASTATNGQTESSKDKGVQEGADVPDSLLSSTLGLFGG